jgi:hypothetical protein
LKPHTNFLCIISIQSKIPQLRCAMILFLEE